MKTPTMISTAIGFKPHCNDNVAASNMSLQILAAPVPSVMLRIPVHSVQHLGQTERLFAEQNRCNLPIILGLRTVQMPPYVIESMMAATTGGSLLSTRVPPEITWCGGRQASPQPSPADDSKARPIAMAHCPPQVLSHLCTVASACRCLSFCTVKYRIAAAFGGTCAVKYSTLGICRSRPTDWA